MILAIMISVYSLSEMSTWCVFFWNDSILLFTRGIEERAIFHMIFQYRSTVYVSFCLVVRILDWWGESIHQKKISTELRETYEEKHAWIRWEKVKVVKRSIYLNKSSIYVLWRSKTSELQILVTIKLIDANRYIVVYLAFVSLSQQLLFLDKN